MAEEEEVVAGGPGDFGGGVGAEEVYCVVAPGFLGLDLSASNQSSPSTKGTYTRHGGCGLIISVFLIEAAVMVGTGNSGDARDKW